MSDDELDRLLFADRCVFYVLVAIAVLYLFGAIS